MKKSMLKQENPTNISLEAIRFPDNIFRIDVHTKNAPPQFLGISFDLNIEGVNWDFQKYELGPIFKKPSELLVLATKRAEQKPRIVFGLSYKGKSLRNKEKTTPNDGKMAGFYIKTTEPGHIKVSFSQNILSIYEKGRKDIKNAVWTNADIDLKQLAQQTQSKKERPATQKILEQARKSNEKFSNQSIPNSDSGTIMFGEAYLPIEKSAESETVSATYNVDSSQTNQDLTQIYFALGYLLAFLIIIFATAIFIFARRKKQIS